MTRAPELPAILQPDNPGLDTLKVRALHALAEASNHLAELTTLVQKLQSVRKPDQYAPHYNLDDWARLVERGEYRAARLWLLSHGVCA